MRLRRFLHHLSVTPEEMIETALGRTCGLVKGRHVLAIQDTTSLRDDGKSSKHQLHASIAVDAGAGTLLGVVGARFLRHKGRQKVHCNQRPFAGKDSHRWLDETREAAKLTAAGAACVTVVADRECDIYDEFALRPAATELLIRCHHDRVLADGTRLYGCTEGLSELGREIVAVAAAPGRGRRDAVVVLYARRVTLRRPKRNTAAETAKLPPELSLTCVEAREIGAPAGATPLHWRLLTTHRVGTLDEARRMVGYYRLRWTIEQVFRTMKTKGFDIEAVRMAEELAFENLVTATLIAAVRTLQMVHDRDGTARRPMEDVFEAADRPALEAINATLEGKTAKQKNPHPPGSLAYATWICARLGGWNCYYGKPGTIVLLRGYQQLQTMINGWAIGRSERP
jgi:Transposase DDE domain